MARSRFFETLACVPRQLKSICIGPQGRDHTGNYILHRHFQFRCSANDVLAIDGAGKCFAPVQRAFRLWPEEHQREILSVAAQQGTVAAMSAHAGDRWGLYLAQSADGMVWERPRVVGEGSGDRGRIELGTLVSFGKRVLLLISAEVTGTSRRGWFVIASDDGGINWGPP